MVSPYRNATTRPEHSRFFAVRRTAGRALVGLTTLGMVFAGALQPASVIRAAESSATSDLPALPANWPSTLQLGMSDAPGGAAALKAVAPFGFRYQYLAGGVNTGNGWANWNTNGEFATYYIQDSVANGFTPVFTYYMIYQSKPGGGAESDAVATNLRNTDTMRAYFNDLKLFFQKAAAFPNQTVVLHVEPDMWGYMQHSTGDNAANYAVQVAATGVSELAVLPNNAAGMAQGIKKLRDLYAPNVQLGYHMSIWGTRIDIQISQSTDAETDALATRSATFYRSLQTDFDLAFAEFSDRDSGFKQDIYGDGGKSWFDADDFRRHARYMSGFSRAAGERVVLWQIPLGNTKLRALNNTWNHYQDNRVEWLLDDSTRAHLQEYIQSGVVAFLFGRGADGATCACDANKDGITNPTAINGNDGMSLTADDDGGFFKDRARAYYTAGALSLSGSTTPLPTPTTGLPTATPIGTATPAPTQTPVPGFTTSATVSPATVAPSNTAGISASVTSGTATTVLVDLEVYDPAGVKVHQQYFDNQSFEAGQTRQFPSSWSVPAGAPTGTYTVKIGIFGPGWNGTYEWNNSAAQFTVSSTSSTPVPPTATAVPPTATPVPPTATSVPPTATAVPPTATATSVPTQAPAASYTTSATVSPGSVSSGGTAGITASVTSSAASTVLVDIEVYSPSGAKVHQQYFDNQSFQAGQTRQFTSSWTVPSGASTGTYTVKIGIFSSGWGTTYEWNNGAAQFSVVSASASPTPTSSTISPTATPKTKSSSPKR